MAASWQAVVHDKQGSLGLDSLESSQFSEACLHVAALTEDDCVPSTPERKTAVMPVMAKTTAIITMYSNEPCALAMVRNRDKRYKKADDYRLGHGSFA